MKEMIIKLDAIDDIRFLVSTVEAFPFEIDLCQGRYIVDAKSLMGIFSLDLSQPLKLVSSKESKELEEKLEKLIVK